MKPQYRLPLLCVVTVYICVCLRHYGNIHMPNMSKYIWQNSPSYETACIQQNTSDLANGGTVRQRFITQRTDTDTSNELYSSTSMMPPITSLKRFVRGNQTSSKNTNHTSDPEIPTGDLKGWEKVIFDLKRFYLYVLTTVKKGNVTVNTGELSEGYEFLCNEIEILIKETRNDGEQVQTWQKLKYTSVWNIYFDMKNYWLYSLSIFKRLGKSSNEVLKINSIYSVLCQQIQDILDSTDLIREAKLNDLRQFIQMKIEKVQNPEDCAKARIMICEDQDRCGFGCQHHWLTNCFINAFEQQRTMVYHSKGYNYQGAGWQYAFLPFGKCSSSKQLGKEADNPNSDRVVRWNRSQRTQRISWELPTKLSYILPKIHGRPAIWWVSQFAAYVTRYQVSIAKKIKEVSKKIGYEHPIVGMHVRRGDKLLKEANRHEVEEYMFFVERWFQQLEMTKNVSRRLVYLATDDVTVPIELRKKYPAYTFIMNQSKNQRSYTELALAEIVTDIHFLSHSDYVVCTLSSNVCRTTFELMANLSTDASTRLQSVDAMYRYTAHVTPWRVIANHTASNEDELTLKVGEIVNVRNGAFLNLNEGLLHGKYINTKKRGTFPAYKARRLIEFKDYQILN